MEFVILGPTALLVDGESLPLGAAKQRGMLAILLYHAGEAVRIERIVDYLWDGQSPDERRARLYPLASRIRAVLHRAGLDNALIRMRSVDAYRLDVDPRLVDFHRFRHMVSAARAAAHRHDHDAAVDLLVHAIDLWRDEPLADLRGERSEHLRQHMKDTLLDAEKLLADNHLKLGRHESVLILLESLIRVHTVDETLAQQWILALCAAAREDEARTFYVAFRRRFRKEMHIEPAVELPFAARRLPPALIAGRATDPRPGGVGAVPPRQLPKDIADFTGHEGLLFELDALTNPRDRQAGVVVVSGMPGVGKTTFVTHWAHRQRHRFPDGELFLNAHGYGPTSVVEPDDALARFLYALDVPADRIPAEREQRRERLNRLLDGRRILLVLDNIGDPDQARPLIPTSDSVTTVITSRNRLTGLTIREGVRHVTVPPLSEPECLVLLDHMLGRARTSLEPEAVRALARISGGLPIALRIIGEHVAERPRARIADLVEDLNNHLLDNEEADGETNLHTLFAWSYRALRPDAAQLFRVLGRHPGPHITPDAAAAMAGTATQLAEHLLNTLAKAHLINHDTARRYRFHDLLHRFAADLAEREAAPEAAATSQRLLDWYLLTAANAAALLAPHQDPVPDLPAAVGIEPRVFQTPAEAMTWSEAERENLGSVTRWAAGHGYYRHAWQLPGTIHEILDRYGRQDDLLELQELALASARIEGHKFAEIGALNNLGTAYFAKHDYRRATAHLQASLDLARSGGFPDVEAISLQNLAAIHLRAGETDAAIRFCERVLEICRDIANPEVESAALTRLGDASRQRKRYDEAVRFYREALAIRERIGDLRAQGATHGRLAALLLETGQADLAFDQCREALEIHARTRDDAGRCDALTTMAEVRCALAMPVEAIKEARDAAGISTDLADSLRRTRALVVLAQALAASGESRAAGRVSLEAMLLLEDLNDIDAGPLRERVTALRRSLAPDTPTP